MMTRRWRWSPAPDDARPAGCDRYQEGDGGDDDDDGGDDDAWDHRPRHLFNRADGGRGGAGRGGAGRGAELGFFDACIRNLCSASTFVASANSDVRFIIVVPEPGSKSQASSDIPGPASARYHFFGTIILSTRRKVSKEEKKHISLI